MGRKILPSQQKWTLVIVMERILLKISNFLQNQTKVTSINLTFILRHIQDFNNNNNYYITICTIIIFHLCQSYLWCDVQVYILLKM